MAKSRKNPAISFPVLAAPDFSDTTRSHIANIASGTVRAAAHEPGDFVAFEAVCRNVSNSHFPDQVLIHIATETGGTLKLGFKETPRALQQRIAMAYAHLVSDRDFETLSRKWQMKASLHSMERPSLSLQRIFLTPRAGLICVADGFYESYLLVDRKIDPEIESARFLKDFNTVGILPKELSSCHARLAAMLEISELARRIAANSYDNAKKQRRAWKYARPNLEGRLVTDTK